MTNEIINKVFNSEQDLQHWAKQAAIFFKVPLAFGLSGEIGMGKTTLFRALLQSLGVTEVIKSPTFTWLETYHTLQSTIHHVDLYRLEDDSQYYRLNLEEYLGNDLLLIEWPEKSQKVLSWLDLHGKLKFCKTGRIFELQSFTALGKKILLNLQDL
jgi:tRNA threonylcarbamoyladenosine biosynthesis protein TsaE